MRQTLSISVFILAVCCFTACSFQPVSVEGTAMLPSFSNGDKIFIDKNFGNLNRGDVITFLYPKDKSKWYFKRVIGLRGENVEIREGKVFINNQIIDEPYIDDSFNQSKANFSPRIVPENQYYVLGDNRDNSSDSRYWGTVGRELIKGKYYMTYSKAGK